MNIRERLNNIVRLNNIDNIAYIQDFTLLWNIFESHFFNPQFGVNYRSISFLINQNNSRLIIPISFNQHYTFFYELIKNDPENYNKFHFEYRISENDTNIITIRRLLQGNNQSRNLTEIAYINFVIAYRIRNNLFHGVKNILDIPNQEAIFEKVNSILIDFIEHNQQNYPLY